MMSLSNRSSLSLQHTNHASSVYSLFSVATDLMTYWFGGKNSTVTAEVQSLAERMQPPEDILWMPSLDHQDTHLRSSGARRLTGPTFPELQINTYTTDDQSSASVAALNDGGFVVTWYGAGSQGTGIYVQLYTASGVQNSGTFVGSSSSDPSIAVLTDGRFVIHRFYNYHYYYYSLFSSSGGQMSGSSIYYGDDYFYRRDSAVSALRDGGFATVWESDQEGSGYGIYGQRHTASGSTNGDMFKINTYSTGDQKDPAIAALPDGGFMVIWSSYGQDGSSDGIYGQRYAVGGVASGQEFCINTYTMNAQESPAIAALSDGGFVVTWASYGQDGSGYGVYGQRYTATGAKIGDEFPVNTNTINDQDSPSVAALVDGGFVVTWSSYGQDGSGYGVYGQRYNVNGVKIAGEFQVNTYTIGYQQESVVAGIADGGFVVIWSSSGQDGSGYGVYGQRFHANNDKAFNGDTLRPTISPTRLPTSPSIQPTFLPTCWPTVSPTRLPTSPSIQPTFLPTQSPTVLPTWFPTYLPSIQPTESPTDQPKTSSSSLAVKDRIEALFTPMVILIAAVSAGGLIGLIACACFIVRSRQKKNMRLAQPSFDLLPSADDGLASTPVHTSPRDQRQECLREVELPTASFSGSASSPASVETSRQISRGQLHSPSSAHALPSTIPLIPSAELIIDYTQCLGEGGFGIVYKGTWQTTSVAVKQLKVKRLPKTVLDSFHEEAMHHASFRHPNILLLYGICLDAPSPSMVMELMTISLYYFLHSYDDFPWSMRLTVAKDVTSGLQYLHSRQTLHRDLKSHNVMLNQQHRAKLSDFGLSKTRTGVSSSMPNSTPGTAGTLHWMAPEILGIDANHTELSDVYALGMVFWEISSREFPFQEYENGNRSDLLRQFIKEGERPTIPAATPPTFAALIARCWAQRAEDRPVCADIVNELNGGGIAAMSSSLTLRRAPTSGVSIDFAEPMPSTSSI